MKKFDNYSFLPKIISSFQDYDNLYLVTNYFEGNNLYLYKDDYLTEEQIKFIIACIIQSFDFLRRENIIHRDIRMHNIIMDKEKYLNILDFSYAINYYDKNDFNNYFIGDTIDNSPEVQVGSIYDYNCDYYRLGGSILYYLIFKKYFNDVKIEKNITEIIINYNTTNYSEYCIDFLNKLVITNYSKRIGFNNIYELKNHSWFNGFNWENLSNRKIKSPLNFRKNIFNQSICSKFDFSKNNKLDYKKIIENPIYKNLFINYDYTNKRFILNILKKLKK